MSDSILCRFKMNQISEAVYHAPTNKFRVLPVELLRTILHLVYPPPPPQPLRLDYNDPDSHYPKDIITLSSVCQLWRDVIIKDPTFWSLIILPSNPSFIQMLISRSGQVPLAVDMCLTGDELFRTMYTMIFSEYHRLKRLAIDIAEHEYHSQEEWELILTFTSHPAPMLEALHLVIPEHPPQLDGLLKGGAPQMKELYIRGECLPLLSFTSLRVLDITISLMCSDHAKAYENLLVLLVANPQLESLTFDVELPDFAIDPNQPPINLPKLKDLIVRTTQLRLPDVLKGLVVPPDIHHLFEMYEWDPEEIALRHTPIEQLEIEVDISTCAVSAIQAYYHQASLFSSDSCAGSRPLFVLEDRILSKFDFSPITFFSMKFYDEAELYFTQTDYESFRSIFWSLPNLHSLEIEHWDRDFEQAEEAKMPYLDGLMNPTGLDAPRLPCPLLVDLKIMHPTASLSYANQLKQCILVRSDARCPFSDGITLFGCTELSSEVRTLLDGLVEWEEDEPTREKVMWAALRLQSMRHRSTYSRG